MVLLTFISNLCKAFSKIAILLISILRIGLPNSKTISDSNSLRFGSRKDGNNNNSNSRDKRFRKKLIKSKSGNLTKFKKIARNGATKIRLSFLTPATKEAFN